jgi:hypothetical protein
MTEFSRVETEFERLKGQFESGALTEAEFKGQLEELMIEDEQGRWWILGYESGLWYYHDGEQWVQSEPPPVAQRPEQAVAEVETEVEVEAPPTPVPVEEPEAAPVVQEVPAVQAAAGAEPTARGIPTTWIVAAVIIVIAVVIVILQFIPLGTPSEPQTGMWADRDVIAPGECTLLHWDVPDADGVRVVGPGTDSSMIMPPTGDLEVCPEATDWYELKGMEWETLSRVRVAVGE